MSQIKVATVTLSTSKTNERWVIGINTTRMLQWECGTMSHPILHWQVVHREEFGHEAGCLLLELKTDLSHL